MKAAALFLLSFLIASQLLAQNRSSWCDYVPRDLRQVMEHAHLGDSGDITMSGGQFPSRVAVRYFGANRPAAPALKAFLAAYFRSKGRAGTDTLFHRELQFAQAGDSSYWFLIQERSFAAFQSEVQPGDTLSVFLLWLGSFAVPNRPRGYAFAVNEFTSAKSASQWTQELAGCLK